MKYLFFLIPFFGLSQKIFTVNYSSQSDIKVFVVNYESQADLNVFKVDYESQSKGNEGLWYFVKYKSMSDKNIFFVEEILILTLIPGLELLRLSVYRISKGRNIFSGDLEHIHHLLLKKFNQIQTNLIVLLLIITPIFFLLFKQTNLYLIVSFNFLINYFSYGHIFKLKRL